MGLSWYKNGSKIYISLRLRAGGRLTGKHLYVSAGGRRTAGGRAAGGKTISISMRLWAGGGRLNDKHLYVSAGGRRAVKSATSSKSQSANNEQPTTNNQKLTQKPCEYIPKSATRPLPRQDPT